MDKIFNFIKAHILYGRTCGEQNFKEMRQRERWRLRNFLIVQHMFGISFYHTWGTHIVRCFLSLWNYLQHFTAIYPKLMDCGLVTRCILDFAYDIQGGRNKRIENLNRDTTIIWKSGDFTLLKLPLICAGTNVSSSCNIPTNNIKCKSHLLNHTTQIPQCSAINISSMSCTNKSNNILPQSSFLCIWHMHTYNNN